MDGKWIAVTGLGAILPDAPDVASFWKNILEGRDSITEVPPDRWDVNLYYDPDPSAVDKSYSKIGAFVRNYHWNPFKLGLAIPPRVLDQMDLAQQWAIAASAQALQDYGYPERKLDPERMGIIFGNANGGESQYRSTFRILLPEYSEALRSIPEFEMLPADVREAILSGITEKIQAKIPAITEDTMPGELSNIISGRVANVFNFSGPNFVTDAACASSLAAVQAAVDQLLNHKVDAVLTGGIDHHMGPESYVKFSKIGALSADGSRPYAAGANGFVMGEGAVVLLLKRLEDAERAGDHIYAVIRGIGSSSDGKGKGITAPNPLGQQRAIERAWRDAGIRLDQVGLIEGHGTSTRVGDVAEVNSLNAIFGPAGLKPGSVALGSVKSNIGHLKSAAGAVGLLKTVLSLQNQLLPPSANFEAPNPNIDFAHLPFRVLTQPQDWSVKAGAFRFAGVSSFGFGGTNFHIVLEEYFPGVSGANPAFFAIPQAIEGKFPSVPAIPEVIPTRSLVTLTEAGGAGADRNAIQQFVLDTVSEKTGYPLEMLDLDLDLEADLGIDTVKQAELFATVRTHFGVPRREDLRLSEYNTLAKVVGFVEEALSSQPPVSSQKMVDHQSDGGGSALAAGQPISCQGEKPEPLQGLYFASADSLNELKSRLVATLAELDSGKIPESRCPEPDELARPERIAIDYAEPGELNKRLEKGLSALEANNPAIWKALQAHGVYYGHGEPGKVAFLFPGQGSQYVNMLRDLCEVEPVIQATFYEADRVMTPILGRPLTSYIFVQDGEEAIKKAEEELKATAITQPAMLTANVAVMRLLEKYGVHPDLVIGHSLGEYAALVAADVLTFGEALEVVSARGQEMSKIKVEDPGCMAAISAPLEKVEETLRTIQNYVVIANINSPLQCVLGGSTPAIEEAIEKFKAQGYQAVKIPVSHAFHTRIVAPASTPLREVIARMNVKAPRLPIVANVTGDLYPTTREEILDLLAEQVASPVQFVKGMRTLYEQGARIFIESGPKRVLNAIAMDNLKDADDVAIIATNHPRKGGKASFNEALCALYAAGIPRNPSGGASRNSMEPLSVTQPAIGIPDFSTEQPVAGSVVISGAGLGLPGRAHHVFEDENINQLLAGDMRIEALPQEARQKMLEKHVIRLVKSEAGAVMEEITDLDQTLKLAGQAGEFDLAEEFGVPQERVEALDLSTQLAFAAGLEALRDAAIPLVMHYRRTSKGTYLPDRWKLPESMQDETGVIFASAFPGLNRMAEETDRFYETRLLEGKVAELRSTIDLLHSLQCTGQTQLEEDLKRRIYELENRIKEIDYSFDRRFVFQVLSMGHSQFAEYIGARGPNTSINAACATTTQAVALAEDWIRAGRCRRVIIIAGDDVTNPTLVAWIGTSLFASGAATTEGNLRQAVLPFDKRRNGMIMGMGAAALVVESEDAAQERGVRAIGEILSSQVANSAYHGTRLDVEHVSQVMDELLTRAERRFGVRREEIAPQTVFVSHETYTPARGGSASAEIHALRHCFKDRANQVIIANTKGFTGHPMGVGIEDVLAVKALETGKVPPIANIHAGFEPDPELGDLNLSQGGVYHPQYALRLGAGFGSQIAMTLIRRIPGEGERVQSQRYSSWLAAATGMDQPDLEVVQRTLRVRQQGVPQREPVRSSWRVGQGPARRAAALDGRQASPSAPASQRRETAPVEITGQPDLSTGVSSAIPARPAELAGEDSEIGAYVLSVVSEKTGYPVEMLDPDLDLEADLGIDTVKQAELFATIRTHYGIPRREDLVLAEYNTLAKVIGFMREAVQARDLPQPVPQIETPQGKSESAPRDPEKPATETQANEPQPALTPRVPVPVLLPRLDLCYPTGVQLAGSRVIVVGENGKETTALAKKLKSSGAEVLVSPVMDLEQNLAGWLEAGPIQGAYFLAASNSSARQGEELAYLDGEGMRQRIAVLRVLATRLPETAFLIAATRMGGFHGMIHPANPQDGAISGFLKALKQERPSQLVKVIDFPANLSPAFLANEVIAETLQDPSTCEIGRENELRYALSLQDCPVEKFHPLARDSVFLVSGGSGGITGPVVVDLAKATRGTFYLMGRIQLPDQNDPDLVSLRSDRNAFKLELQERLSAAGEKATPVRIEQILSGLERGAATLQVMDAVQSAGGKAIYLACDVTDPNSVEQAVQSIRQAEKKVAVFIHAAGLDQSRKLENKTLAEMEQVISVKAAGFQNIFTALEANHLLPERIVFFSSVAGRFGNSGQTDYAAANDLLSKYSQWLPSRYAGMQTVSIDWGAWAEVGMASRGHIPELMRRAGIEMLQPEQAAPMVREVLETGRSGEVVVAGSLGRLDLAPESGEIIDTTRADEALRAGTPQHAMFSHLTRYSRKEGIRLEAELDPKQLAFLRDHAINGIPVLPGVAGIEGFAVAARHIASVLASGKEGFTVERLENIQFHAPFKFYGNKPRTITWIASATRSESDLTV